MRGSHQSHTMRVDRTDPRSGEALLNDFAYSRTKRVVEDRFAHEHPCPKCKAEPGSGCTTKRGWAHKARVDLMLGEIAPALAHACPSCGAKPQQMCTFGQVREYVYPHDSRLALGGQERVLTTDQH